MNTKADRDLLVIPFDVDSPMVDSDYYQYLKACDMLNKDSRKTLVEYVKLLGYDETVNRLEGEFVNHLNTIEQFFYSTKPAVWWELPLDELFTNPMKGDTYKLTGDTPNRSVTPTPRLKSFMGYLVLVYDIDPEYYFFEIINGYLFLVYDKILGSRRICRVVVT